MRSSPLTCSDGNARASTGVGDEIRKRQRCREVGAENIADVEVIHATTVMRHPVGLCLQSLFRVNRTGLNVRDDAKVTGDALQPQGHVLTFVSVNHTLASRSSKYSDVYRTRNID